MKDLWYIYEDIIFNLNGLIEIKKESRSHSNDKPIFFDIAFISNYNSSNICYKTKEERDTEFNKIIKLITF